MFIAALVKMLPAPKLTVTDDGIGYYDQLIHSVFKSTNLPTDKASVIAFASASKGAGVSFITQEVGHELARYGKERTAIIDARKLQSISKPDLEKWAKLCATAEMGISWLTSEADGLGNDKPRSRKKATLWQSDPMFRQSCLQLLRRYFKYVLIDCHSVNITTSLTLMAELVDGVVIIAAAGQTRRDEIQRMERVVEMAQGKMLGFILNKRRYPVPRWLYEKI